VLLYGYPGCGKTFLGMQAQSYPGVNFYMVRGPELFDKYVGASEAKVRDVFQRARETKPSVIFFDEFDALAQRRSNDSHSYNVGIVNQLLTELDGVESLDGVAVVASSSRPDLIDPALLRPGRLGELVFLDLPVKKDRFNFLKQYFSIENAEYLSKITADWSFGDLKFLKDRLHATSNLDENALKSTVSRLNSKLKLNGLMEMKKIFKEFQISRA
jgi:peroxin-1